MQIQPVPHISLFIVAFGAVVGAIFGATLIGLAGGLAVCIIATLLE